MTPTLGQTGNVWNSFIIMSPFELKDIGFPLKDIHIIDNWLPVQLHYWIDYR